MQEPKSNTLPWVFLYFLNFANGTKSRKASHISPSSADPTKWSNTLKQFAGCCRQVVWVCLTILWDWGKVKKVSLHLWLILKENIQIIFTTYLAVISTKQICIYFPKLKPVSRNFVSFSHAKNQKEIWKKSTLQEKLFKAFTWNVPLTFVN